MDMTLISPLSRPSEWLSPFPGHASNFNIMSFRGLFNLIIQMNSTPRLRWTKNEELKNIQNERVINPLTIDPFYE